MSRHTVVMLWIVAALLAATNGVVYFATVAAREAATPAAAPTPRWERLSAAEQLSYVQQYRAVREQPGGNELLEAARAFASLEADEQAFLRDVREAMTDALLRMKDTRRSFLLRLSPEWRAAYVYRWLRTEAPETLASLAQRWAALHPEQAPP